MVYPKWKYHAEKPGKVVKSAEEEEALGEGWADSPAAFKEKSQKVLGDSSEQKEPPKLAPPQKEVKKSKSKDGSDS